jgi:hypothetical protein
MTKRQRDILYLVTVILSCVMLADGWRGWILSVLIVSLYLLDQFGRRYD